MPKISVIVPVYKVEKYLRKCVKSILDQTYPDLELLLIDDGSPDSSGAICDELSQTDSRIRVFHKENGGVSAARNLGLDNAQGEWVTFVDADDWLDVTTLGKCMAVSEGKDLVRFSMAYVYDEAETDVRPYQMKSYASKEEYLSSIVARETILGVCGGLYLKSVFDKNNIRFDTNITNGEDWLVLAQYVNSSVSPGFLDDCFYKYNQTNEVSCSNSVSLNKLIDVAKAFEQISMLSSVSNMHDALENGCFDLYKYVIDSIGATKQYPFKDKFAACHTIVAALGIKTFNQSLKFLQFKYAVQVFAISHKLTLTIFLIIR